MAFTSSHQDVAAELSSGSSSQDALKMMKTTMYPQSDQYRKAEQKALDDADALFGPSRPAVLAAITADPSQGGGEPGAGEPSAGKCRERVSRARVSRAWGSRKR